MNRLLDLEKKLVKDALQQRRFFSREKSYMRSAAFTTTYPVDARINDVPAHSQGCKASNCWGIVSAMMIAWRDNQPLDIESALSSAGQQWLEKFSSGNPLSSAEKTAFLTAAGLVTKPQTTLTIDDITSLLRTHGPVWLMLPKAGSFSGRSRIITGIRGNGDAEYTFLRMINPRLGKVIRMKFATFLRNLEKGARGKAVELIYWPKDARFNTEPNEADAKALGKQRIPDEQDWYEAEDFHEPTAVAQSWNGSAAMKLTHKDAAWASDAISPDYRHLNTAGMSQVFSFTSANLENLCRLNNFDVSTGPELVIFGLRGCELIGEPSAYRQFSNALKLSESVPDHLNYRCVIGVWNRTTNQLAAFTASTVPNWKTMRSQQEKGGQIANMLPTGLYRYHVGDHTRNNGDKIKGVFRQQPKVVLVRSNEDLMYETNDYWERHSPSDNIHPGFRTWAAKPKYQGKGVHQFSSAGCQTIPGDYRDGKKDGQRHSGEWQHFRERMGLGSKDKTGWGKKFFYVLLTGRDARLVSNMPDATPLTRLRFGSSGADVQALQMALSRAGLYKAKADGKMGQQTTWAYMNWQKKQDNDHADGIVTPAKGLTMGFDIIRHQSVPVKAVNGAAAVLAKSFGSISGDGSPFRARAHGDSWKQLRQLSKDVMKTSSIARKMREKVKNETGFKVDENPYWGITSDELDAVIRAAYESVMPPEDLLALWVTEGSSKSVTTFTNVPEASSEANAKALFRSDVYYEHLGADFLFVTTRISGGDNKWENTDSSASAHEKKFKNEIAALVRSGHLAQDISSNINAELTIRREVDGTFSVKPSTKFYALSLIVAGAYFNKIQQKKYPELSKISSNLNYLQWNMGSGSFATFLKSAEAHRKEPEFTKGGNSISLEDWTLHTVPKKNEWRKPRFNAVRFMFYRESYRPIFAASMKLIKPTAKTP